MGRWQPGMGAGNYGGRGAMADNTIGELAEAVGSGYDAYHRQRDSVRADQRQKWLDELTLRKYLDDGVRADRAEARLKEQDGIAAEARKRADYLSGFQPTSLVTPEMNAETVSRLGPNGTVERIPRWTRFDEDESYDNSRDPRVTSFSTQLYKDAQERGEIGASADAVAGMGPGYQSIANTIRGVKDPTTARELTTGAALSPFRVAQARAGAGQLTAAQGLANIDRQLDDIAAEAKGDPDVAAQLARDLGLSPAQIQQARGRATNWKMRNTENLMVDRMFSTPQPKTVTPTGATARKP